MALHGVNSSPIPSPPPLPPSLSPAKHKSGLSFSTPGLISDSSNAPESSSSAASSTFHPPKKLSFESHQKQMYHYLTKVGR